MNSLEVIDIYLGLIVYGKSGVGCEVISISDRTLTVKRPDGEVTEVFKSAILRWEAPGQSIPAVPTIPAVEPVTVEPDPFPIGTRLYLRNWFSDFDPDRFKPEWWEVTEPANQHGIYLLKSDSGNSASLGEFQISRDLIEKE